MKRLIPIVCAFFLLLPFAKAHSLVSQNSGLILNPVHFYSDSTFQSKTLGTLDEGTLVSIIHKTKYDYTDPSEDQKFFWYQVEDKNGKTGWVYGEAIATFVPGPQLPAPLQSLQGQSATFKDGFENSTIWFASINGRENLYEQDYMNPRYVEGYMVITNEKGISTYEHQFGDGITGSQKIEDFYFKDITGDQLPDFIIHRSLYDTELQLERRDFKVYAIQAGTMRKLFEEDMTLLMNGGTASPAQFKSVDIDPEFIRVEYVDFVDCKQYNMDNYTDNMDNFREYCMEYVVETFIWDKSKNMFTALNEKSTSEPCAKASVQLPQLQARPNVIPANSVHIQSADKLRIIKYCENSKKERFFYLKMPNGRRGYLPANQLSFGDSFHAELLNHYFKTGKTSNKATSFFTAGDFNQ